MITPLLKTEQFSFTYPEQETPTLRDVSLALQRGEFVVLCGPSGCGKTTLLRQFKTSMAPHGRRTGEILFDGAPLEGMDQCAQATRIGFVQQTYVGDGAGHAVGAYAYHDGKAAGILAGAAIDRNFLFVRQGGGFTGGPQGDQEVDTALHLPADTSAEAVEIYFSILERGK